MKEKYIIEDVLAKADKLTDRSLLALLLRVDDVELSAEQKRDDLLRDEIVARGLGYWTELDKIHKEQTGIDRIIKLLQEQRPKKYITYYPTDNNKDFIAQIEYVKAQNIQRAKRGDYPLPIPTKESEKVLHPVGYWTEEQARRYGYTTKKESETETIKLYELQPLIDAGYLDQYGQPTSTDKKEQAVLAYFVAEKMGRASDCWEYIKKIWGDKYKSLPTHLNRARKKDLFLNYKKKLEELFAQKSDDESLR